MYSFSYIVNSFNPIIKMKKLFYTLLLSLISIGFLNAQDPAMPVNEKTGKITYMEVVDATGLTAKDLYAVLKDWAKSQGFKVKEEKEAEGEMTFEAMVPVEYARVKGKNEQSTVNFSAFLMAKDGKYRFIFSDFVHASHDKTLAGGKMELTTPACGPSGINAANWSAIKKKTHSSMEAKIADLKKLVKATQNDPSKNKDW
jgi:hypothetical protein